METVQDLPCGQVLEQAGGILWPDLQEDVGQVDGAEQLDEYDDVGLAQVGELETNVQVLVMESDECQCMQPVSQQVCFLLGEVFHNQDVEKFALYGG